MSYTFEDTTEYKLIKGYYNCVHWPKRAQRTPMKIDPKSMNYLYYLCVNDRYSLGKKGRNNKDDVLNNISITKKTDHILTCRNQINGESITITAYLCDLVYDITIARYKHYYGFSTNINTIAHYNHAGKIEKQLAFSVADILKYYYYTNKDSDNHGFPADMKPCQVKHLWSIVKKSISQGINPHNIPLGTCEIIEKSRWSSKLNTTIKLWDIKNHKVKWEYDNFFNSLILMDYEHFVHPACARNLLYLFAYGVNNSVNTITRVDFEEPMSLIKVIEEYENKKDHMTIYVKNRIGSKLNRKQKEELECYPELVLDRGFMSSGGKSANYIWMRPNKSELINRDDSKMFSYPLFAFRNIYVQDWIPGESLKVLHSVVECQVNEQRNTRIKRAIQQTGKHIYIDADDGNYYKFYGCNDNKYNYHNYKREQHLLKRANRQQLNDDTMMTIQGHFD
jgi:hypothetical protein